MRYDTRYRSSSSSLVFPPFNGGVKWLIIVNVAIYLVRFFAWYMGGVAIFDSFRLIPSQVLHGAVWQLGTYLFLHSINSFTHILFNMLMLWMFGAPVEQTWGTRRFLQYYFLCGVGAGICFVLVNLGNLHPGNEPTLLGASGAIFGLLLACGMLFPEQVVMLSFLFPIKMKYMVMIFGAIEFMSSFQGDGLVSHVAHMGGMIFGYIYMKTQFGSRGFGSRGFGSRGFGSRGFGSSEYKPGVYAGYGGSGVDPRRSKSAFNFDLVGRWKAWQLQRARNKFKVYMKKQGSDRDNWVN